MPTTVSVRWFPQRLNAAISTSFTVSLAKVAEDANAHSWSKSGAVVRPTGENQAVLSPTGLGAIEEKGARPHEIDVGSKGFLAFKDGGFSSGPVQHPGMAAEPFLRPAAARWANGGYQSTARGVLAAGGFR